LNEGLSILEKRLRLSGNICVGTFQMTAAGSLLLGLFQDNTAAFWAALFFFALSLFLNLLVAD
jgi:hypothetical protein